MASAPSSCAARATLAISPVLGVSLTHSGSEVEARSAFTTAAVERACIANALPSSSMLGHEMLASMAATPSTRDSSAASRAKPSFDGAEILTTSGGENFR